MLAKSPPLIVLLLAAALVPLFAARPALAQSRLGRQRLSVLQQQNALQQQQNAIQIAVQQTTVLFQSAYQQIGIPQPVATTNLPAVQQQQSALQNALQQTSALLQASYYNRNNILAEFALRQQNTIQLALQQSTSVQGALLANNGKLTLDQLQLLSQEQTSLTELLTSQAPTTQRTTGRR
jgi:hypothetical protein